MENTRKSHSFTDIGNDARRQYIDTQSVFSAWEEALREAAEVRGGMYWKRQGKSDYLIRTSVKNTQKSLGVRSPETEAIHAKFTQRKSEAEGRVTDLQAQLVRQQRMNRALHLGRAPQLLVDILAEVARSGVAEHFTVIGTHALYAYEAAAGVRIESPDALATKDVDLLWDTRRRLRFMTQMRALGTSMLALLKKVDPTFKLRRDQRYTAVNSKGFEVDILRPLANEHAQPMRMTEDEADFWAVYARRADVLLHAPVFSSLVISPSGHMARMRTVAPATFIEFKRWMAGQADRDPLKAPRDALQAELVEDLVAEYLPQLVS
jgi:Nucleotidyltransferase